MLQMHDRQACCLVIHTRTARLGHTESRTRMHWCAHSIRRPPALVNVVAPGPPGSTGAAVCGEMSSLRASVELRDPCARERGSALKPLIVVPAGAPVSRPENIHIYHSFPFSFHTQSSATYTSHVHTAAFIPSPLQPQHYQVATLIRKLQLNTQARMCVLVHLSIFCSRHSKVAVDAAKAFFRDIDVDIDIGSSVNVAMGRRLLAFQPLVLLPYACIPFTWSWPACGEGYKKKPILYSR